MQSPLVNSSHSAVHQISLRIKVRLPKKGTPSEEELLQKLDYLTIRARHLRFNPRIRFDFISKVKGLAHESVEEHTYERLQ